MFSTPMLMISMDGKFYPELSMSAPLILDVYMVVFILTYPPWNSIMDNDWNIFIAEFSDLNMKLISMDKLTPLQEFSSIT